MTTESMAITTATDVVVDQRGSHAVTVTAADRLDDDHDFSSRDHTLDPIRQQLYEQVELKLKELQTRESILYDALHHLQREEQSLLQILHENPGFVSNELVTDLCQQQQQQQEDDEHQFAKAVHPDAGVARGDANNNNNNKNSMHGRSSKTRLPQTQKQKHEKLALQRLESVLMGGEDDNDDDDDDDDNDDLTTSESSVRRKRQRLANLHDKCNQNHDDDESSLDMTAILGM